MQSSATVPLRLFSSYEQQDQPVQTQIYTLYLKTVCMTYHTFIQCLMNMALQLVYLTTESGWYFRVHGVSASSGTLPAMQKRKRSLLQKSNAT